MILLLDYLLDNRSARVLSDIFIAQSLKIYKFIYFSFKRHRPVTLSMLLPVYLFKCFFTHENRPTLLFVQNWYFTVGALPLV